MAPFFNGSDARGSEPGVSSSPSTPPPSTLRAFAIDRDLGFVSARNRQNLGIDEEPGFFAKRRAVILPGRA